MWDTKDKKTKPDLEELMERIAALEYKLHQLSAQNKINQPPLEQYMDIASACSYLGMGRTTLYDIMNKGLLAYTYVGRQRRVLLSDVKKYIQSTYVAIKPTIL